MDFVTITIEGMTCGGCVASVRRVLGALPGVTEAEVSLERAQARVGFDPARVSPEALREAIRGAGYGAS